MDRNTRLCANLDLELPGLEIGPSYNPVAAKADVPTVRTVDHATRDELVAKYRGYGLDEELIDRIDEVDVVWSGGSLLKVVPDPGSYHYIIASHFIEHTVDLIEFLQDCDGLLAEGGVLALAIPDKRFTFDRFKPLTSLGDVIEGHHAERAFHPVGALVDHAAYACTLDGSVAWYDGAPGNLTVQQPDLRAVPQAEQQGLAQAEYVDIHRWIFTPQSFLLLIDDLRELGYHRFEQIDLHVTGTHEFLVSLRRTDATTAPTPDRAGRLATIEQEHAWVLTAGLSAEVEQLRKRVARLSTRVERLRARRADLEGQLSALQGSRSLRLARRARRAAAALRGAGRRS